MEQRTLGSTDLKIAPLVLGAINFGMPTELDEATRIVDRALDGGINMIDVADVYAHGESEKMLGSIFDANGRRDDVLLATKVGFPVGEDDHRPNRPLPAPPTFVGRCSARGNARGVRRARRPARAHHPLVRAITGIVAHNLLDRRIENELLPLCAKYDLGVIPWGSIGQGILAGRYANGIPTGSRAERLAALKPRITPEALAVAEQLEKLAAERGLTSAQLALVWCKDQPGITAPIVGPRTLAHLEDSLVALDVALDDEARAACDELVAPGNAVADFHNSSRWTKPLRLPGGD